MNPIAEDKKSRNATTRRKAEALESALLELARIIEAESVDREALAEIERLEQQLLTARAKLKTSPAAAAKEHARKARAWALKNGVDCPPTGRVPQHVIAAYELHA